MKLAMGQFDIPQEQKQPPFELDIYKTNIAVFGVPMSGKTTFIKTLLVRIHENTSIAPQENIYILDFGGNLGKYEKLSNVCACFDSSNEENIKRVFKTIDKRLSENVKLLKNNNYYSVLTNDPEAAPPHMILIIENINSFISDDRYSSYQDTLLRFCREGLTKGLTVVITANEIHGMNRLLSSFGQKVAFEMPPDNYSEIFNTRATAPLRCPGRGLANHDSAVYEFQGFVPFIDENEGKQLEQLIERSGKYSNPHKMMSFPEVLNNENFEDYRSKDADPQNHYDIVVGLDYYEHKPVSVNIKQSRSIAIYGKRQFGKTNLLYTLLNGIKQCIPEAHFVFVDDGREELLPFKIDEKYALIDNYDYYTNFNEFWDYLSNHNCGPQARAENKRIPLLTEETPAFTVFVLQARILFRSTAGAIMTKFLPLMISEAISKNYLFIFSDVPKITNYDIKTAITDNFSTAFLLDNIGDFVADRGKDSAFSGMDPKEMKQQYAKCSIGDGYYYDIDADRLKKLKFIKNPLGDE